MWLGVEAQIWVAVIGTGVATAVLARVVDFLVWLATRHSRGRHLALQLALECERFAQRQWHGVANSDYQQEIYGEPYPTLELEQLDDFDAPRDEWTMLPAQLLHDCLDLPATLYQRHMEVRVAYEVDPDIGMDEERKAAVGNALDALALARNLRAQFGWPTSQRNEDLRGYLQNAGSRP
tara:strand:- start:11717 stop:12253 length:537 start_codon:yes stop_codon:yes gene_type:complete